jgi:hypothetical protein
MKLIYRGIALFSLLSFSLNSHGQDKIYLNTTTSTATREGKIIAITPSGVLLRAPGKKSKTTTVPLSSAVLVFNEAGNFLPASRLDLSDEKAKQAVNTFLHPGLVKPQFDNIYTVNKLKIEGVVTQTDATDFYITVKGIPQKVPKTNVLAVIYRTGSHVVYGSLNKTIEALLQPVISSPAVAASAPNAIVAEPADPGNRLPGGEPDKAKATFEELAPNVSKKEFEDKALQKARKLNDYLKLLYNKTIDYEEKDKVIEQAITLFVDRNVIVQSSSLNSPDIKYRPVGTYLRDLKLTKYDKVELEWMNVQYVSNLVQDFEGNYRGTVTFEQVFRGYKDGHLIYKDITRKTAEVVLKSYAVTREGKVEYKWDVLLSTIGVTWTK